MGGGEKPIWIILAQQSRRGPKTSLCCICFCTFW